MPFLSSILCSFIYAIHYHYVALGLVRPLCFLGGHYKIKPRNILPLLENMMCAMINAKENCLCILKEVCLLNGPLVNDRNDFRGIWTVLCKAVNILLERCL